MGTVYRARQAPVGRDVAIKILRSDRAVDEASRARFLREARANSLLTSPNTVTMFDFGQDESGNFYLAMELLEGESLGQRIKRIGRLDVDAAIETARQALRSLSEAHAKGVIHRDLKPDNLFYAHVRTNERYEEIVKVLDFGIAKMVRDDEDDLTINAVETMAGTVFGTPRYMSPEQAQGKSLDARSDLYSLGVILYHMLTGRPPFTDDDAIVVMARHIKTTPRPMREVAPDACIPAELENVVMRLLSKEPEKRPESAEAMASELLRAREALVPVTSGVRMSLLGGFDGVLERPRTGGAMTPSAAAAATPTDDTLSVAARAWRGSKRKIWIAAVLGALGLAIAALLLWSASSKDARQPASAMTAAAATAAAKASAGLPPPQVPSPAAINPVATAATPPLPASPARSERSAGRPPRPANKGSAPSVGYGYLE